MAAEAQAEGPAPPALPLAHGSSSASSEKRALPALGDGGGEHGQPELKRRRACVAALDSIPCAAAAGEEVDGPAGVGLVGAGASFSFHHARGGFVALETTPKFGSFNPPSAAELAALDLKLEADGSLPPPAAALKPDADGSVPEAAADLKPDADGSVPQATVAAAEDEEEDKGENSQVAEVDGPEPDRNDDSGLTSDQP